MLKTLLGIGGSLVSGGINAAYTEELNRRNAERNHYYWGLQNKELWRQSEKSAENAFQRQIELYNMFQSPQALVEQYKKAGLNPALLYSMGGVGGHITSAPQASTASGNGAGSQNGLQQLIDPLTSAQIANINADTKKKEQEVLNVEQDTALKKSTELLNSQAKDQNQRKFEHELGLLIATTAIAENDVNMLETKNQMTNKQLEILQNESKLKQYEEEMQKAFKNKGWDLSSISGLGSLFIQMGDKLLKLLNKFDIKLPEWMIF